MTGTWLGLACLALFLWRRCRNGQRQATLLETRNQDLALRLAQRNQALERLHHQLKENVSRRLSFLHAVTHDLRSPLTSIQLGVDRLRDLAGGGEGLELVLGLLEREARRMETLLRGLLDQSRAQDQASAGEVRLCHPGAILQGLVETLEAKAQARGLRSELALDAAAEACCILADPTAMQQVLYNLLENALTFTDPPGAVGIRSRVRMDSWLLEVWDEGPGIEADRLELIFLPCSQSRRGDGSRGWGLGLSICKDIVEAHQGTIQVEREPGRGSCFRVTLPLVLPA